MKIEVKNDNKITFVGKAEEFLLINECDPDIEEMILEAKREGYSRRLFFSGTWEVRRISVYEELQHQYPDKEIKLIPYKYLQQYISFGFKCIYEWMEKSSVTGEDIGKYCFIIEQ